MLLGANRDNGANAGSRASNWNFFVWNSNWNIGARFSCEYLYDYTYSLIKLRLIRMV